MEKRESKLILLVGLLLVFVFSVLSSYNSWSYVEAASGSTTKPYKPKHTHSNQYNYVSAGGGKHYIYVNCTKCGASYSSRGNCSYGSWKTTRHPTCTSYGKKTRSCGLCGSSESMNIAKLDHDWSGWKKSKTEHWKECNNCGTEKSRDDHYDDNIDGYCDACNYLMAIPGAANISGGVAVKEGEGASFSITLLRGTPPITYQWYYNTSNSTSNGVEISGATGTSVSIASTTRAMNGRYYYCAMTNKAGTHYSPTALLTVYYPFTIGSQPKDANLKKGESATFSVTIGTKGNPDSYTYQWYVAASETATGSKLNGATKSSYTVTPTKNIHEEWYYCVISNGQYTATSERAKLVADVTSPEITMGTFDDNRIINNTVTVKIPFTVTDTGEGYTEGGSNFTASDIIVKVGGIVPSGLNKTLTFLSETNGSYQYELTLSNINGNGNLALEIPADSIKDNFQNGNLAKNFSTRLTIDNIAPVINFESITSGLNGVYANAEDTLIIRLSVTEAVGMNTALFTEEDIMVLVGGVTSNTDIEKDLTYLEKDGNKYMYQLVLTNVKGEGGLSLRIPSNSFVDYANNPNIAADLDITTKGSQIIIDNTKPVINSLVTTLGSYNNTARDYPTSIATKHQNWAKEDIYSQINATDNREIDYYMKSTNGTNYSKMSSHQEVISDSIETIMYYQVVDMAGNISDPISKEIKLDKVTPDKPVMLLTEQREGGAPYVFDPDKATTKSIYVKPDPATVVDKGPVQSGIAVARTETYYTITRYREIGDTTSISETTYDYNQGILLRNSGYYEIRMYMVDIAGNSIESDLFKAYIDKRAENTIRIKNINDIGSGISKVTIRIYASNVDGSESSEEAIDPIVINNPYKEIVQNVRLGDGIFYVKVTLEDKVGNSKLLTATIENKL